jgi:aminopeptidase
VTGLEASEGGATLQTIVGTDPGAARLGEVALVDREGRIGELGTIFYDTLLDENAASHIALGQGFPFVLDEADRSRANESEIHIDFMIGSDDLRVTGITPEGDRVPVLVEGRWQI